MPTNVFVILLLCYTMQVLDPYLHSEDGFVLFIKKIYDIVLQYYLYSNKLLYLQTQLHLIVCE